jgi:hypothetical protein
MSKFIDAYCSTCNLCLHTKTQHHAPYGELQPLPVPPEWWDTISMDFIMELPESQGFNAIMVVVDLVAKRAHFVPIHTIVTANRTARLFLHHIWKLHGLPRRVVSDRGPQFIIKV